MTYQVQRIRNADVRSSILSNARCAYCRVKLDTLPEKLRTVDHIVVRSNGVNNDPENLLPSCHSCNSKRGDRPLASFVDTKTLYRIIEEYPRCARHIVRNIGRTA